MDILFSGIIVFLLLLAVVDLSVGVSNDATNFLNSAIGARAASFKRVIMVAAVGVFIGAAMSNGMMDIARHGIFRPEHFSFYELVCIFMAVMVTDVILLDIFNTLGLPTSTTVSLVFEMLGASFAVALFKMAGDTSVAGLGDLLNTEKAISVILGIFLSVAIALVFGTIVQFITRLLFSFSYNKGLKWKIGIFGGIASTAIVYFLMIKGIKDLTIMTPDLKSWIAANTVSIIVCCLIFFSILMQALHWCKVNVLKVIVLMGTFALAMAFAGNDLVNFIGIPLTGFASYQDYMADGAGDAHSFMMGSLNSPANTPLVFLLCAGVVMVVSLATSKKAKKVVKTSVDLSRQGDGYEMFGSSRIARHIVRWSLLVFSSIKDRTPSSIRAWIGKRFNTEEAVLADGAAFDLIRGSVNLVLAGMLIALGTSMKLPLSTTYVTFMVAMGTSLADRAWGRESAVFRITGVISVIGGWFITAGVAFIGAGLIVSILRIGGTPVILLSALVAIAILIRNNVKHREKKKDEKDDAMFQTILNTNDKGQIHELFDIYIAEQHKTFLKYASSSYDMLTDGFINDKSRVLSQVERSLIKETQMLKTIRRKETLCLRRLNKEQAIEKSTWFHLANNCCMSIIYNLRRINEVCKEHVDNNFRPLPPQYGESFTPLRDKIIGLFSQADRIIGTEDKTMTDSLRRECDTVKDRLSACCKDVHEHLRSGDNGNLAIAYVYLNTLQESQEMVSSLRKLLRASLKLHQPSGQSTVLAVQTSGNPHHSS